MADKTNIRPNYLASVTDILIPFPQNHFVFSESSFFNQKNQNNSTNQGLDDTVLRTYIYAVILESSFFNQEISSGSGYSHRGTTPGLFTVCQRFLLSRRLVCLGAHREGELTSLWCLPKTKGIN